MDKDLIKIDKTKSGICHHMMFEKIYINELINKIEKNHNDKFYNVFLKMVTDFTGAGASEYEIYFNFMLQYHRLDMQIRNLSWTNCSSLSQAQPHHAYVAIHHYMR